MRTPLWSGEPGRAKPHLPIPVWWPGPPSCCLILGPAQKCVCHICQAPDDGPLRFDLAPCVGLEQKCDFCLTQAPQLPFFFFPAQRYIASTVAGHDWQDCVLALDEDGRAQAEELFQKHVCRGAVLYLARIGRKTNSAISVHFCQDVGDLTIRDAFDVKPVLTQKWRRWLREPAPDYEQPLLPWPLLPEEAIAAAGGER